MDDVVISVTHAEDHVDVHADVGGERAMLIDERVALLTRGIESAGE
jgi:hypothetical protein